MKSLNEEIVQSTCSAEELSDQIKKQRSVVPGHLYHIGRTDHLYKNIAAGNVPQEDWDNFIMNGKGRYNLTSARRGLYGTVGLDTNTVGRGRYNWIMRIALRPECRKPERVATLDKLHLDQRFIDWFPKAKRKMTFEEFKSNCEIPVHNPDGYVKSECDEIAVTFFHDLKIFVIQDHVMEKSFYIRNRDCIERITGTPDEWVKWLADVPEMWSFHCQTYHERLLPGFLIKTLIKMDNEITPHQAHKLSANVRIISGIKGVQRSQRIAIATIEAKLRCGRGLKTQFQKVFHSPGESFEFYLSLAPELMDSLCR
ncbi:MAG: hypothetical protein ACJ76H_09655 [Bacteriovoracaceae bacterium]